VIAVQVVYARPESQRIYTVRLPLGATVADAIHASGLLQEHPSFDLGAHRLGIFGRIVAADRMLGDGDRVEIYRPLKADPKEARRKRAGRG
jgi:putative ubiquitin-RnfH superfamily antitoxin RatB of RatAB toxin-antitoxin module